MKPMIPLASLLNRALKRAKVDVVVSGARAVDAMQAILDARYGADAGLTVKSLKGGVLSIAAPEAPARAELTLVSGELIAAVNTKLGKSIVKELRFR